MTIDIAKHQNKIIGIIGICASIAAMSYANSFVMIFGLTAFNFFSMVAAMASSAGVILSRPNGVTSEQAGAIPDAEKVKAQIAALQKQLPTEAK